MNSPTRTIWMNVTTSAFWQRPPVGIVRVERSLSNELSKLYGATFRQCIWQGKQFVAWSPEAERNAKPEASPTISQGASQKGKAKLDDIFPILSKRQALKALAQSMYSLLPSRMQPLTNRLLHRLKPRFVRWLEKYRQKKLTGMSRQLGKTSPVSFRERPVEHGTMGEIFAPGDILISVGLDWDHPYYKEFYKLRQSSKIKIVTCCYDLIPVLYPQYCVSDVSAHFASYFLDVADGSDLVLCISLQSEKDLNDMLYQTGGARPPTWVFPLGDHVPQDDGHGVSASIHDLCQEPFILYVSTIERRKNHEILYRAYHLLCAAGYKKKLPKLVFVGMQGWGVGDLMKDIELDPLVANSILLLNHVTDTELKALYEASMFCVFPSLYEGWGLPVGEALAMGKVVLASGRGSLPEVGGELVKYIDPWSPQSWAQAILQMVENTKDRHDWEKKIQQNYAIRTWQSAARSVQIAIEKL
jgi:glycosyltransferase involved in cell wall biosynthesis